MADARDRRRDPTGTTSIRRRFDREIDKRFKRLRALITEAVVARNVFGLGEPTAAAQFDAMRFRTIFASDAEAPPRRAFVFRRDRNKVGAFMRWLRQAEDELILSIEEGTPVESAAASAWTNVYVDSAYQKGIRDAAGYMREDGIDVRESWIRAGFARPVHADRLGLAYIRTFTDLRNITAAMDAGISESLAQGLAEGLGMEAIARLINNRVDKIGRTRARVLARTEIISAHAEATLNSYREAAIEGVIVESEFTTADDDDVCPICENLEERIYTLQEASGVIPVHPNCRCAWRPVVKDPPDIVLR